MAWKGKGRGKEKQWEEKRREWEWKERTGRLRQMSRLGERKGQEGEKET